MQPQLSRSALLSFQRSGALSCTAIALSYEPRLFVHYARTTVTQSSHSIGLGGLYDPCLFAGEEISPSFRVTIQLSSSLLPGAKFTLILFAGVTKYTASDTTPFRGDFVFGSRPTFNPLVLRRQWWPVELQAVYLLSKRPPFSTFRAYTFFTLHDLRDHCISLCYPFGHAHQSQYRQLLRLTTD